MKQHTEDYKQTAVKYYLDHNEDMRDTCEIFNCKFQSLARWVKTYKNTGKIRKNHNLKITPEIEKFVKEYTRKYNTATLWELSKLVNVPSVLPSEFS